MAVYDYLVSTGVIVPDTATTRTAVENEFKQIFGQDFITDPETPQGQWIDAETTSRQSVARNNAAVANQINPNLSGGPFLDAIWALTFGGRNTGRRSTVSATVAGVSGTIIPAGSRARTTNGDEFRAVNPITIPVGGSLAGAFESVAIGAIEAGVNTLTVIVDPVLGWETITNGAAAALGQSVQSDQQGRLERNNELALVGRSVPVAVISNVSAVTGVRSLSFLENITGSATDIQGINLVANSIWVAVHGGSDADIAMALLMSKTAGAAWNGSQSVAVTEPRSGQSYTVRFDRATTVEILVRITINRLDTVESPIPTIRNIITAYANGEQAGETGFVIGQDVSPYELSGAVNRTIPQLFVSNCEVAVKQMNPTFSQNTLAININQRAVIAVPDTDITVVISS